MRSDLSIWCAAIIPMEAIRIRYFDQIRGAALAGH